MYQLDVASSLLFVVVIVTVFSRKAQLSNVSDCIDKVGSVVLLSREEATKQIKTPLQLTSTKNGIKNHTRKFIFKQLTVWLPKL